MENKTIKQNANNIMWVEYWINKTLSEKEDQEIIAEKYDEFRWICEIKLPLINKTVKSISDKEVNAMLNACNKAAKLIDEYMKDHPELKIYNMFKGKSWEITSDENGKYISTGMSNKMRQANQKQLEKMSKDSLETIKKAFNKIAKINGSTKNLFIQVLDQSLFDDEMSIDDILEEVDNKISKDYNVSTSIVNYDKDGECVIVMGYTFLTVKKGE